MIVRGLLCLITIASVCVSSFVAPSAIAGPLLISPSSPILDVHEGETNVGFFGTLKNTSSDYLYLNSDNLTAPDSSSTSDNFFELPSILSAGQKTPLIELFSFDVLSDAPLGIQRGTYAILGGDSSNPSAFNVLGSEEIVVDVLPGQSVNEPVSTAMLLAGLGCLCFIYRFRAFGSKIRSQ